MVNISPDWRGSTREERRVIQGVLEREATPSAVRYFAKHEKRLGNYWYWFVLGTIWISYSGHSDLNLWRSLFSSSRPGRETSLMKPDELEAFRNLPCALVAYRAHRDGETDWISYTLDPLIAARFAVKRMVPEVVEYEIPKSLATALFLRRGEKEILATSRFSSRKLRTLAVKLEDAA